MGTAAVGDYWNHNTAYHPWVLGIAAKHRGDVLDVGCGDGLLAQRLARVSRSVTGIEPDHAAADRARQRVADHDVEISRTSFEEFDPGTRRFDLVTFVASLHHMDLRASLARARDLLTPSGEIAVVGLSANKSAWDWAWSACSLPAVAVGDRLHRATPDIGVTMAEPRESLGEIRRAVAEVLPGVVIRRKLYYRYVLRWSSQGSAMHTRFRRNVRVQQTI
ncbi:MAG TPA: class I SAM-dependent methyltransferase [Mycobacterium sp.]|jgi:SAM-dependent methyltransferase|nr:class I SAM-dependent methyltransferase [Mycobacterium sp.]